MKEGKEICHIKVLCHKKNIYSEIPIISPRLTWYILFKSKKAAFSVGLFSVELIFGGAYYWRVFCISKWVALDNINSLKH